MENRAHALIAGLFVLLLGAASAVSLWWLAGQSGEKNSYYLVETRRDVTGLMPQANVTYRGIRAGKVESIDPDEKDRRLILIRISLNRKYQVTPKTIAKLGVQGLTGLAYVELQDDGTSDVKLEADGDKLPRITMKTSLLEMLSEKGGDIATQVSEVATRLNLLLSEKNTERISRTLENVATASEGFKEVPQVMAGMRALLSAENIRRMNSLLVQVEKVAGEASPLAAEVREMVKSMTALSRRIDELAAQAGTETVPRLNSLLREMDAGTRQLSRVLDMLNDSPQALIFGRGPAVPGPGETGFGAAPAK